MRAMLVESPRPAEEGPLRQVEQEPREPGIDEVRIRVDEVARTDTQATLLFTVSDTGIGIAKEQLERIFDSFTQADASMARRFGGTGLGLTISREFAQLVGGEIRVESEPGKGTCFSVYLPSTGHDEQSLQREEGM